MAEATKIMNHSFPFTTCRTNVGFFCFLVCFCFCSLCSQCLPKQEKQNNNVTNAATEPNESPGVHKESVNCTDPPAQRKRWDLPPEGGLRNNGAGCRGELLIYQTHSAARVCHQSAELAYSSVGPRLGRQASLPVLYLTPNALSPLWWRSLLTNRSY